MSTTTLSPPRRRPTLGRWSALPVLLAGTFIVVLDFFIVNVALPTMRTGLHASTGSLEWVVAGYSLATAALLVPGARLGEVRGRRAVFAAGLGLFTLASAGCGLAPDPVTLIVARIVQGAGAALVMPTVLALLTVVYDGADRARALAAYAMAMGAAAAGGQLIGGGLLALDPFGLGWRAVFLVNVPVGIAALLGAPRLVPESRAPDTAGTDLTSVALAIVGLTAVVLPLLEGRSHGWPAWTWLCLAAGTALLLAFAARQRTLARTGAAARALVSPEAIAGPMLRRGLVIQLVFWAGQASFFLVLALYLQSGRGLSALDSGLVFTVLAVAYVGASMTAPALTERHGRAVLAAGALLLAAGHGALFAVAASAGTGGSLWLLIPGLVLAGAGMGLALPALATLVLGAAPPREAGAVSAVLTSAQNVGNAIGVAVLGVVFFDALGSGGHGDYGHAFARGEAVLAGLLLLVAALSRRLPATARRVAS